MLDRGFGGNSVKALRHPLCRRKFSEVLTTARPSDKFEHLRRKAAVPSSVIS